MKEQGSLFTTLNRVCFLCVGLLAVFGIAMPTGTLRAQESPDATGYVTCDVVSDWSGDPTTNTIETVIYPVELPNLDLAVVTDRWGPGKDLDYTIQPGVIDVSKKSTVVTMFFYEVSDPLVYEDLYSETGMWEIRVGKDNKMSITGNSYAVIDRGDVRLLAKCSWSLAGTFPAPLEASFSDTE